MPDVEENKQELVDIDTSGPDVDIQLEEPKEETVVEETKVEEVKEEPKVEETKVEEPKVEEKKAETKPEELEEYSEGVQKRIAKLTKKWREAERQREAALEFA